ncbi:protein unc-93 homolog A [Leptidea sinapis]|uniref:protein unc-93 homolog A n=1 Tax=Leptidea sinapis TaxID=189913 RepID=UPI0021C482EC|nr:protein unc-93 homolog A [Leptidea sinapis]
MGSLPDLTERSRSHSVRPATRTISDPHRHHAVIPQIPVGNFCKKEWLWRKSKTPTKMPQLVSNRRRESVASSLGATSVRRLITRPPQKLPKPIIIRFSLLCVASGLCSTVILPFTAFAGAEAGATPLAIMHAVAAIIAPFSPIVLQRTGTRAVVAAAHVLVGILLLAHSIATPLAILLVLYALCGLMLSPMQLALAASATSFAQAAGDELKRKVMLRRALRALKAAQDVGLVFGSSMLGLALIIWPENLLPLLQLPTRLQNYSTPGWPPSEDDLAEEDFEEMTCGASGCPDIQSLVGISLSAEGRTVVVVLWAILSFAAAALAVYGAASIPSPPPDARSIYKDPRAYLSFPMGLFIGLQQGFIYTSYIKWYGVCIGGWSEAWRALCGAGALQAIAAVTLSMAAARGRRGALAAGGAAAHASLLLALLRWRAARTDLALPTVAASAWGACAALWDVLQVGLCVGGAGWRGPWSLTLAARHAGVALACGARQCLCVRTQLAVLALALVAGLASHTVLELKMRRDQRHRT